MTRMPAVLPRQLTSSDSRRNCVHVTARTVAAFDLRSRRPGASADARACSPATVELHLSSGMVWCCLVRRTAFVSTSLRPIRAPPLLALLPSASGAERRRSGVAACVGRAVQLVAAGGRRQLDMGTVTTPRSFSRAEPGIRTGARHCGRWRRRATRVLEPTPSRCVQRSLAYWHQRGNAPALRVSPASVLTRLEPTRVCREHGQRNLVLTHATAARRLALVRRASAHHMQLRHLVLAGTNSCLAHWLWPEPHEPTCWQADARPVANARRATQSLRGPSPLLEALSPVRSAPTAPLRTPASLVWMCACGSAAKFRRPDGSLTERFESRPRGARALVDSDIGAQAGQEPTLRPGLRGATRPDQTTCPPLGTRPLRQTFTRSLAARRRARQSAPDSTKTPFASRDAASSAYSRHRAGGLGRALTGWLS